MRERTGRRGDIDRAIGEAAGLRMRGDYRNAASRAEKAYRMCGDDDAALRCRVVLEAARGSYGLSRFDECRRRIEEARSLAAGLDGPVRRRVDVEAAILLANVHRRRSGYRRALDCLRALDEHDGDDPPALVGERLLVEGACLFYLDRENEAQSLLESALGLATHSGSHALRSRILAMLSLLAQNRGLSALAGDYAKRAGRICDELGDRYGSAAAALNLALVLRRRGELSEAGRQARRARKGFAAVGWRIGHCRATIALGMIRRDGGDRRGAVRLLLKAERIAADDGYRREACIARLAVGGIRLEQGMLSEAERLFRGGIETAMAVSPTGDLVAEANRRLGELFLVRGAVAPAIIHLKKASQLARQRRDRLEEALSRRLLARCDLRAGDAGKAAEGFREAGDLLRRAGCMLELAHTRLVAIDELLGAEEEQSGAEVDIDELWTGALEAVHLLSGAEAEDLLERARTLLGVLSDRRRVARVAVPARSGGDGAVEIRFSEEYCIADGFVAVSEGMNSVWRQIGFAASFDRPVLVTGETGTGKELVARMIHRLGDRRDRPFVAVNCAAIPDHLFESEFFGHRKGSFTGALTDRTGFFEEAAGGTLFLDEVGELSTLHQVKLLRVLQEGRVRRLGENVERPVDVRIVSATNRNVESGNGETTFREDFYYRINAERIHLPPLRERPEDIIPLVSWVLCGQPDGPPAVRIVPGALKRLQRYGWPGNVRELFTVLDRVGRLVSGGVVTLGMLPPEIAAADRDPVRGAWERAAGVARSTESLKKALSRHNGNKTAAARWLGISRGTLYKELRRAGLEHLIRGPRTA